MAEDLARVVYVADKDLDRFPIVSKGNPNTFEGQAPIEMYGKNGQNIDYQGIRKHYGGEVATMNKDFNEPVLTVKDESMDNFDGRNEVETGYVTSVDILAKRAGVIKDVFNQIAVGGIIRTSDDYALIGTRGGKSESARTRRFASRMFGYPPGGSAKFKVSYQNNDPVWDTFHDEILQELLGTGVGFPVEDVRPAGIFYVPVQKDSKTQRGPDGFKIILTGNSHYTLADFERRIFDSNELRGDIIEKYVKENADEWVGPDREGTTFDQIHNLEGAAASEAERILKERGLPWNSWEHENVFGIEWDIDHLENHLVSHEPLHSGISFGTTKLLIEYIKRQ